MSQFQMAVPEGWVKIDVAASGMAVGTIITASATTITDMLKISGLIGESQTVAEFRVFDEDFFIVRLIES